jgi:hypothetical protein
MIREMTPTEMEDLTIARIEAGAVRSKMMDDLDFQIARIHGITPPGDIQVVSAEPQVWQLVGGHVVDGKQHDVATQAYGEEMARKEISKLLARFGQTLADTDKVVRIK